MEDFAPALVEKVAELLYQRIPNEPMWSCVVLAKHILTAVAPTIYEEIMTDTFHPEFGTAWREPDGECYKAYQQGCAEGARQVLAAVEAMVAEWGQVVPPLDPPRAAVSVLAAAREAVARIEGGA